MTRLCIPSGEINFSTDTIISGPYATISGCNVACASGDFSCYENIYEPYNVICVSSQQSVTNVYSLVQTGYSSLEECVSGCDGACIQGSGKPTSIEFETFTIPDALQIFDQCNDPSLSNAIIDTGPLSTQGTPYVASGLNICPECLAICVTASGIGTAWWFNAYDALGQLVLSQAGGYEGNEPVCFGQSCNTNSYSLSHSEETPCDGIDPPGLDTRDYVASLTFSNDIDLTKFDWIPPYDSNYFNGYSMYTVAFTEYLAYYGGCDGCYGTKTKTQYFAVICIDGILWDMNGIAVSGLDFTYFTGGVEATSNYAQVTEVCDILPDPSSCPDICSEPYFFNITPFWPKLRL